ncbi:MAG: hypothetical protein ACOX9R_19310 [Armatimonadota bacterium]
MQVADRTPSARDTGSLDAAVHGSPPRTLFAVTVDVEADDEWRSTGAPEYRGIGALPRLQELCDRYQVWPTYLVTFDVASDPDSAEILRELASTGRCEIGAHMHPWRTPPLYAPLDCETGYRPYLYDYPDEVQAEKMANLTHCIEDVFQRPITSYRAGRWGIDAHGCDLLEGHGYVVDTSVTPLRNRRRQLGYPGGAAGPDFLRAPSVPYHPSESDVTVPGGRALLEIPVSSGVLGAAPGRSWHMRLVQVCGSSGMPGETALKLLRKTRAVRVVDLTVARNEEREMVALAGRLLTEQGPVLNMAFHSSELVEGASPAVVTSEDAARMWRRIEAIMGVARSSRGAVSSGLTGCAAALIHGESRTPASRMS